MHILFLPSNTSNDLSDLDSISKALEASLERFGWYLAGFTALVVLGLIIEYWEDIVELWDEFRWPMALFPWKRLRALLGAIMVTIGVAGELAVSFFASNTEQRLRDNNHRIEAVLNSQAAAANERAGQAEEHLAELQRAELPRTLDINRVASKLTRFKNIRWAMYIAPEVEPSLIADMIQRSLEAAKWQYGGGGSANGEAIARPGIWIEASSPFDTYFDSKSNRLSRSKLERAEMFAKLKQAADALKAALADEGLAVKTRPFGTHQGMIMARSEEGEVDVFVSVRPMPGMPEYVAPTHIDASNTQKSLNR